VSSEKCTVSKGCELRFRPLLTTTIRIARTNRRRAGAERSESPPVNEQPEELPLLGGVPVEPPLLAPSAVGLVPASGVACEVVEDPEVAEPPALPPAAMLPPMLFVPPVWIAPARARHATGSNHAARRRHSTRAQHATRGPRSAGTRGAAAGPRSTRGRRAAGSPRSTCLCHAARARGSAGVSRRIRPREGIAKRGVSNGAVLRGARVRNWIRTIEAKEANCIRGIGIDNKIAVPLSCFLDGLDLNDARAVDIASPDPASLDGIVLG